MTVLAISSHLKFCKEERLSSRKQIAELFSKGKRLSAEHIRLIYKIRSDTKEANSQIMISVPKKIFKKAVHRNILRRRIREAYRLNKFHFIEYLKKNDLRVEIAFLYSSPEIIEYKKIEMQVVELLNKLANKLPAN
jgi:ribonuclease P protein component